MNQNEQNDLLTVNEFAAALRVKVSCIRRWISERKIEIVHIGRLVRIPSSEVTRIVVAGRRAAAKPEAK